MLDFVTGMKEIFARFFRTTKGVSQSEMTTQLDHPPIAALHVCCRLDITRPVLDPGYHAPDIDRHDSVE